MLDGAVADGLAWLDFVKDFSAAERAVSAGAAPKKLAVEAVEPKSIAMKGAPHAQCYIATRRYTADEAGSLRDVHPDDVAALEKSGFQIIQPKEQKHMMVNLRGKPHQTYQCSHGRRYEADAHGIVRMCR